MPLLQTAEVLRTVRGSAEFGVNASQPTLDLPTSQTRKQQVIDRLTKGLESLLKGREVAVISGTGTIVDAANHHVRVSDGTDVTGDALIIATGSVPHALPGLDFDGSRILSSDHVLEVDAVPARVAIIGAGAIGCEFASMLADFGTEVTLIEALPRVLPGVDAEVSVALARAFRKRGINSYAGARVTSIEGTRELAITFEGPDGTTSVSVDQVIVSIGRAPRTQGIGLESSAIDVDARGYVRVNQNMQTSVPGVYAVGDVVDTPQLAHVAFAEAIVAIKAMIGETVKPIDYEKVPWGIYGRALILGEPEGIVKIVAERDGPILGVHIVGPWATELLGEGYLAVNWEAAPEEVATLIHPHPTLSELFGEAALALTGRPLHG